MIILFQRFFCMVIILLVVKSIIVLFLLLNIFDYLKDLMSNWVGQLFWHGASAHFRHLWNYTLLNNSKTQIPGYYKLRLSQILIFQDKKAVNPKLIAQISPTKLKQIIGQSLIFLGGKGCVWGSGKSTNILNIKLIT